MKQFKIVFIFTFALATLPLHVLFAEDAVKPAGAPADKQADSRFKSDKERYSYAVAVLTAQRFKDIESQIDMDLVIANIKEIMASGKPLMAPQEVRAAFAQMQQDKQAAELAKHGDKAKNRKESEEFLAENGKKEGIATTKTGLQYQIVKEAHGDIPKIDDTVVCHYTGTLIDGTKFDSSIDRGEPAQFPVRGVIPGWTEVLQIMPVGSKWKLFIPSDLAYGERGHLPKIGPDSALIFELELLSINKPGR